MSILLTGIDSQPVNARTRLRSLQPVARTIPVANPATHHTSGRAGPLSRAGSQSLSRRSTLMFRLLKRSAIPAVGLPALAAASPAFACPSSNAIGNFQSDPNVGAAVTTLGNTSTYLFSSINENPVGGVPGLIEYCIYPSPSGNPTTAAAMFDSWKTDFKPSQGYFLFRRPNGDPTNVPLDGSTDTIGTAT